MATRTRNVIIAALVAAFFVAAHSARAEENALDRFLGRWDVRVKTLRPKVSEVTYTETYEWVLDRQFLRGMTGRKSDGTEDVIYATYDPLVKGYPFWIFSSSGTYVYLAPATWDARKRTMEWTNPPNSDISWSGRLIFTDENTRRWTTVVKDWKGAVLLEHEGSAIRRKD
ncbi:MAG: hypothetical protein ACREV9_05510 [Burkholderiales bacterium]